MKMHYDYDNVVLKFGGSVIFDDDLALRRVAEVIKQISLNYIIDAVVVSAIGKTTNALEAMAHRMAKKPNLRELDALLATGEMQTAALLSMRLNEIDVAADSYNAWQANIITDNNFGNAKIHNIDYDTKCWYRIPVITGFQGITKDGDLTTLGREGSDITAIELAIKLNADFCWFFKDGGGIYDKNPEDADARLLNFVPYQKMLNYINSRPGQVLHSECVKRAKQTKMPMFVSGIENINSGTWIATKQFYNSRNR